MRKVYKTGRILLFVISLLMVMVHLPQVFGADTSPFRVRPYEVTVYGSDGSERSHTECYVTSVPKELDNNYVFWNAVYSNKVCQITLFKEANKPGTEEISLVGEAHSTPENVERAIKEALIIVTTVEGCIQLEPGERLMVTYYVEMHAVNVYLTERPRDLTSHQRIADVLNGGV